MLCLGGSLKTIDDDEANRIHQATLKCLCETGMKIHSTVMLEALAQQGAKVDKESFHVKFPYELIDETIEKAKRINPYQQNGVPIHKHKFSWHSQNASAQEAARVSFGGACLNVLYAKKGIRREATVSDMIDLVRFGEVSIDVGSVGNPVIASFYDDGTPIDPRVQSIESVALLAKHTSKWGEAEVWSEKELDYVIQIGSILRGSYEQFIREPILISPKDTISPLVLPEHAADVFVALAKRGLPCSIVPVPICGVTNPITSAAAILLANAEILGTMAAILSINENTPVMGGAINAVMNMKTVTANYSAPEAILADIGLVQLYRYKYGLACGLGAGYIDAKYPGTQSGIDSTMKTLLSSLGGNITYSAGLVDAGKTFCPEQAIIDIENAKAMHAFMKGIEVNDETLALTEIMKEGIGGNFISTDHTFEHFRENFIPELFDRTPFSVNELNNSDLLIENAYKKYEELSELAPLYAISETQVDEINKIVDKAHNELLKV